MSSDSAYRYLKRHEDAITTLLPDGFVAIMKLRSTVGFTLSPPGALLWELSDGNSSLSQIIDTVETLIRSELQTSHEMRPQLTNIAEDLIAANYLLDLPSREPPTDS